jgi:hypothetical protein
VCLASTGNPAQGTGFLTFAEDHVLDWVWNNRLVIFGGVLADIKVSQRESVRVRACGFGVLH